MGERGYVSSQLSGLAWGEVFAKKGLGEVVLGGEQVRRFILQPITGPIHQRKGKEPQPNGISRNLIELYSITFCKKIVKIHMEVIRETPSSWSFTTKGTRAACNSKLFALMARFTMHEVIPNICGET